MRTGSFITEHTNVGTSRRRGNDYKVMRPNRVQPAQETPDKAAKKDKKKKEGPELEVLRRRAIAHTAAATAPGVHCVAYRSLR